MSGQNLEINVGEKSTKSNIKRIFSGIQPSGRIQLGNYLGAIKNWVKMQDDYRCIYCVVDQHAITVRQNPAELRKAALEIYAQLIACGVDPEKSILFIQSHVSAHAQLAWVLNCYTMFGELSRMTQFKDKSNRNSDNINCGLFAYPCLMAADILLYQADLVPVGDDQKQHVELARNVANRFNGVYSPTFTVPEPFIPKQGARVMSLTEPQKKMSKSDENPKSYVLLMDTSDDIMRKFKSATTDSQSTVRFEEGRFGINNLISIYAAVTGLSTQQIENEFEGKGYGEFKTRVGEAVAETLRPVREETLRLLEDKQHIEKLYRQGAERARAMAARTISKVYKKIGFVAE